jgi:hypothetical protein
VWTSWAHIWLAWFCSLENRVWHCLEVLLSNEEEGASSYRWRGGHLEKCFIPIWKVPNRPPSTLNLGDTTIPTLGKAVSINRPSLGPNGASGGAAAPWAAPFWPIFVRLPLVFSWTWAMVVFYEDKVVWLEFGLVLHSFGPWFCWLVDYLPLGLCQMSIMLHFLYTLGSFPM